MKVLLVSSGSGPWPNDGWGAVENLTADFAWSLENAGIDVKVYHEPKLDNLINVVRDWNPNIVHVEYDDHAVGIIPILRDFPTIQCVITTHYAFLSQPFKLIQDGYMMRFLLACDLARIPNVTLAVLSEEIKNTYHLLGNVPNEKMWVFPNGNRTDLIKFFLQPKFPMKAICVGKIETRKNQALLQDCKSIDFIGPISDDKFQITENYKGKWNRQELYEQLGQYSCLVLISQAEAHPLVIGEALSAGLSIVCNKISSANLPKDKCWIKIVPDSILKTPDELSKVIEDTCAIGVQHRNEIRKWAEENIDYKIRVKEYCEKFNLFPSKKETPVINLPDKKFHFITLNDIGSKSYIPQGGNWL